MATDNSTASTPEQVLDSAAISLNASRANMVFAAIKDVAESFEFNSGDEDVIELAKQALTIIGLATLGHELTNNIVEVTA